MLDTDATRQFQGLQHAQRLVRRVQAVPPQQTARLCGLYDDLMAATRYAVMMLREAKTLEPPPPFVMPRRAGGGWMAS